MFYADFLEKFSTFSHEKITRNPKISQNFTGFFFLQEEKRQKLKAEREEAIRELCLMLYDDNVVHEAFFKYAKEYLEKARKNGANDYPIRKEIAVRIWMKSEVGGNQSRCVMFANCSALELPTTQWIPLQRETRPTERSR